MIDFWLFFDYIRCRKKADQNQCYIGIYSDLNDNRYNHVVCPSHMNTAPNFSNLLNDTDLIMGEKFRPDITKNKKM